MLKIKFREYWNNVPFKFKPVICIAFVNAVLMALLGFLDFRGSIVVLLSGVFIAAATSAIIVYLLSSQENRELNDLYELNRQVVNSTTMGILVFNAASGQCVSVSPAAAAIIGASEEELLKQNFYEIPSWRIFGLLSHAERALQTKSEQRKEIFLTTSSNRRVWVDFSFNHFIYKNEPHLIVLLTDITKRKDAEEKLRATYAKIESINAQLKKKNAELDDFAYIASHDLKEPLRAISNYSRFILEDYGDKLDDEGKRMVNVLISQSSRMEQLINMLLRYSRVGREKSADKPVDLNVTVKTVIDDLRVQFKEDNVIIKVDGTLPVIESNPLMLEEIFHNLITNAIKYNNKPEKHICIGCKDQGGGKPYVFYVSDNGIGIPGEHYENIFKIFKRLHTRDRYGGGTGAGLTIVKKMVESLNGRIWVESVVNVGSTFFFTLGEKPIEENCT
jgi:PAS domain S-box-containing protein